MPRPSLVPDDDPIRRVDAHDVSEPPPGAVLATDDHDVIRTWAQQHGAEPATGEATESGPATIDVKDGGAGIRFNFPGVARFRPISWDEWFRNFTQFDLMFVFERDDPGHAPTPRYRLVPRSKLRDR
jgi:hypothetical protein